MVEELLYDLIEVGQLSRDAERWQLAAGPVLAPPPSMRQLIAARIERLAGLTRQLLATAAVYGDRFPLPAVEAAVAAGEVEFGDALQEATAAQLIGAAEPGWYRFHHPLSHAAVLQLVSVAERRQAAGRPAGAVLAEDPDRTGATCRAAGRLLAEAGQFHAAGRLYARAGREAHGTGALELAVTDLTEAVRLLPAEESLIGDLVTVLVDTWQPDQALKLVERLPPATGPDREQRALTLLNLTWGFLFFTSRPQEGQQQLANAQALIRGTGSELAQVHRDLLETVLTVDRSSLQATLAAATRLQAVAEEAERLARTAAEAAERHNAAEAACRSWLVVHAFSAAPTEEYLERISALAEEHNLAGWQFNVRLNSAVQRLENDGDVSLLCEVHAQARQFGMVGQALSLETAFWVEQVQLTDGSLAPVLAGLTGCLEQARRLRIIALEQMALSGFVLAAGYRADRTAFAEAAARLEAAGGFHLPAGGITVELGSAICLALEGRDGEALANLEDLVRRQPVVTFENLVLPYALRQLLGTVAGTIPPAEVATALKTAGWGKRGSLQFLHAAAAVHAGRQGDRAAAEQHAAQARAAAEVYPTTRWLIARLIAPAAAADG